MASRPERVGLWMRIAEGITHHFRATLVAVLVATAVLAVGITGLAFDTSQNGLIGKSSKVAIDNVRYQKAFGGEAMLVLESGPVEQLFTPANLAQQRRLEARLRSTGQFSSVIGPVDALEFAANQLKVGTEIFSDAIAQAQAKGDTAEMTRLQQVQATETSRVLPLVVSGKLSLSDPAASLDQPDVVKYLLYDETGKIRPILRDNFPNTTHGLVIVRLQGNTDIAHIGTASDTVKRVVEANPIAGFRSLTTGPPVLLKDINDYLQGGMATLGGLAILVMTVVLFVVFRVRWRLLSLAVVALGALTTFGILGYASIALSLVTISGFPILIGLAVDFAIQVHSRFEEEVSVDGDGPAALRRMYRGLAPALTIAMAGAALGFVAIQVSRVPIIRDFGVMLDVGVVLLFLIVVLVPPAMLVWRERRVPTEPHPWGRGTIERVVRTLAFAAERLLLPILVIGLALVATGLVVEGSQKIQTDPEKWVPQGSTVVHDLRALRRAAGFSSEIGLFVEAPDVTSTSVTSWMQEFGAQQVARHQHDLLRATSLPAIVAAVTRGAPVDKTQYDLLVSIAPAPFKTAFVSPDGKSANMVFPVGDISLGERQKLLEQMGLALKPPSGVNATFSGLAVVGVELVKALQANRSTMIYLSLGAVALWLLIAFRNLWKVALPLVPVLIALGSSSVVVYLLGIELSPLTAVSGPLIIAVCTEFSVLIMARYVEERERGLSRADAVDVGAVRIGRAFVGSGLTLVGGFAVLAASPFPLLRDFGIIVSVNALLALLSALFVLPPLLMWADRHPRIGGFRPGPREEEVVEPPSYLVPNP